MKASKESLLAAAALVSLAAVPGAQSDGPSGGGPTVRKVT